jgi:hypothetical protein
MIEIAPSIQMPTKTWIRVSIPRSLQKPRLSIPSLCVRKVKVLRLLGSTTGGGGNLEVSSLTYRASLPSSSLSSSGKQTAVLMALFYCAKNPDSSRAESDGLLKNSILATTFMQTRGWDGPRAGTWSDMDTQAKGMKGKLERNDRKGLTL